MTEDLERSTMQVVGRRLIPFLMLCYFLSYLDRTNISIASLTMNKSLGLTAAEYGLGAGLFFIGYFLFEIPSNLILHRVGARLWIARIMVSWGVVAVVMAAIQGPVSLYVVRIVLGIAEAGFFPGIILYLTYWFPASYRGRAVAFFMSSIAISTAVGAPLGGLLLGLDKIAGLDGWRWLFVLEGVPTVIVGILVVFLLPSTPRRAKWLTDDQRNWLVTRLDAEDAKTRARHHMTVLQAIVKPRVLALSLIYFATVFGLYGIGFWLPQIIKKSLGISSNLQVSLLTAVPYAIGIVAMILWGRYCDRTGRYAVGTAVPMLVGGVALTASAFLTGLPWLGYAGLCVCTLGVLMSFPGFWGLPSAFLTGAAAAAGIATVNTIGNLSGFLGPYWVGWMTPLRLREMGPRDDWAGHGGGCAGRLRVG
ncbi:MFS transporter [Fodinicola feengrottensis]|uniref:MFS transporter n=1 Tax=Fodinicola feengrottensis TaxID=435914 RepID=UPI0013D827F7|nr:MFS transporter [Fodinicola feengrottensis]